MNDKKPSWLTTEAWKIAQEHNIEIKGRFVADILREIEEIYKADR